MLALAAIADGGTLGAGAAEAQPVVPCDAREYPQEMRRVREVYLAPNADLNAHLLAIASSETTLAQLDAARGACKGHLEAGSRRYSLPAYMCVGEASLRIANEFRTTVTERALDYQTAACAFQSAALLAERGGAGDQRRADTHAKHAETLMAWRALIGPATVQSAEFLNLAVTAYEQAIRLQATAGRHLALGRAYLDLGREARAEAEIRNGFALEPNQEETAQALAALVQLAEYKRRNQASPEEVIAVLNLADGATANSVAVNGALGVAYFDLAARREAQGQSGPAQQALTQARAAFGRAIAATATAATSNAPAPATNYRAEAHYYLSVLDARNTPVDWAAVIENADAAVRAGGGDVRYRRQACLAHIARGAESVRAPDNRSRISGAGHRACDINNTPEGELLRGMLLLREAQHFNIRNLIQLDTPERRAYFAAIGDAEAAFDRGERLAAEMTLDQRRLQWPDQAQPGPDVLELLRYGSGVLARECPGFPPRGDLNAEFRARGRAFFERYRLASCRT